ncbi:hypothetical protein Tcan_10919 [Toxocara canis]|uniref:Uncharacterized protein n=1 Tax=Toxocara canis TaxID=6265 RepID=A0A0B2VGD5_TOXCA|nr:hypothetical protein Tcan_10919 [Toxocara canis]
MWQQFPSVMLKRRYSSQTLKDESKARLEFEKEYKQKWEEELNRCVKNIEAIRSTQMEDNSKYKERFTKINEALAALEKHLEMGNKKVDKIITADIQMRRTHEKGLLAKANEMDERVTKYMDALKRRVDDVNTGKRNVQLPAFDADALRREMESIAADKNKISMEGLLKLEEKMSNMQKAFIREHDEIVRKLHDANDADQSEELKMQMKKLDEVKNSMEMANKRLHDKVERQIPNDKLAESVTTVKDLLERKINGEIQQRERDVEGLLSTLQSFKKQ